MDCQMIVQTDWVPEKSDCCRGHLRSSRIRMRLVDSQLVVVAARGVELHLHWMRSVCLYFQFDPAVL